MNTVVVLGHWTIIAVDADGGILPQGVLDGAPWTRPRTSEFRVMPSSPSRAYASPSSPKRTKPELLSASVISDDVNPGKSLSLAGATNV